MNSTRIALYARGGIFALDSIPLIQVVFYLVERQLNCCTLVISRILLNRISLLCLRIFGSYFLLECVRWVVVFLLRKYNSHYYVQSHLISFLISVQTVQTYRMGVMISKSETVVSVENATWLYYYGRILYTTPRFTTTRIGNNFPFLGILYILVWTIRAVG